jgi:hypothetical protein
LSTVLPITDKEARRIHSQIYLGSLFGGKSEPTVVPLAPVVMPMVKGRFGFPRIASARALPVRGGFTAKESRFGGKYDNIAMHGMEDVKRQVAKELAARVMERLEAKAGPGSVHRATIENPSLARSVMDGEGVYFSEVNGMGEAEEHLAGIWDSIASFGAQIITPVANYAKDRYLAKQQAEDALKLEASRMNALLKQQQKELAMQAQSDANVAAQSRELIQQQAALKEIEREGFKAKLPLYISLVALVGALGYSIYKRKR